MTTLRKTRQRFALLLASMAFVALMVACAAAGRPATPTLPAAAEATESVVVPTEVATEPAVAETTPNDVGAADGSAETAVPVVEPVAITYFTPAQQEGPYYPVDKPADRDNDLVDFAGATAPPAGDVLSLSGVVYGAGGLPVEGAVVEIWQTDQSGVYHHPDDPGTGQRDPNFQFYGESMTGADGVYSFRTILPGLYGRRPRHIHVKVRLDGQEVLTTQFYFAEEVTFIGEEANLLVEVAPAEDDAGAPIWVGARDIVLRIDQ